MTARACDNPTCTLPATHRLTVWTLNTEVGSWFCIAHLVVYVMGLKGRSNHLTFDVMVEDSDPLPDPVADAFTEAAATLTECWEWLDRAGLGTTAHGQHLKARAGLMTERAALHQEMRQP